METNLVSLIENSINEKNQDNDLILETILKQNININQAKLMIKYIKRFCILSSILDSEYMNYFNKTNLLDLREKDELTDENFANAVVLFIKEKQKNKKLYMVKLESESDIKINILILSSLDYNTYEYDVIYNEKSNLKNNLNIFNYIYNLKDEYDFCLLSKELISDKIDSPLIPYVNLNESNYQKILDYSKLYPNRIRYLDCYGIDKEKLKILLELNKNSLKAYPHGNFKLLAPLPNATKFNIINLNLEDFNHLNYNFSKIKEAFIEYNESSQENSCYDYINILNKFNNLEKLVFSDIDYETLFKIIENIKCKKVLEISGVCEDLDEDYNYEKLLKNLPLLEKFLIEEHQTMNWTYEISPIFKAERKRISFLLLEQIIRNYLKENNDRDIELQFDDEFEQFWEYFKTKKDIISRISKLYGPGVFLSLESYFKGVIKKLKEIPIANYKYLYVEELFDEKIFDFIKNNKIEHLFIKKGGNVNINNLIKCENLKFVFDNTTKIFLFRIKGILQNF